MTCELIWSIYFVLASGFGWATSLTVLPEVLESYADELLNLMNVFETFCTDLMIPSSYCLHARSQWNRVNAPGRTAEARLPLRSSLPTPWITPRVFRSDTLVNYRSHSGKVEPDWTVLSWKCCHQWDDQVCVYQEQQVSHMLLCDMYNFI